ncbi:acyl-CoA dehydrogenase family protein [Marinobacter sp. 2_MG-2023]|uniref:acyl-CoA dehydrogenase family protein n=1 Tax=Marinobacter sp. 2_MG-2023 TaxID=3062679 RepID=UPI0026E24C60|nr:acyl-CoA dehydrogenase family protein [Marinobacter sp. 2_MG-2023]MDO6441432.1 acyl-CoA dehydrogenase family protein [Marinobacter sp. 2_MG-2023]
MLEPMKSKRTLSLKACLECEDIMLDQDSLDLLFDSIKRFLQERYGFADYQRISDSELGWSQEMWQEFVSMGWLGLTVPEEDGGLGATAAQCLDLFEHAGGALVLEPLLPTLLIAGEVVRTVRHATTRKMLANGVIGGDVRMSLVPRQVEAVCTCSVIANGDGFHLKGRFPAVLGGANATHFVVSAQLGDEFAMFLVPKANTGVEVEPVRLIDGRWGATLNIDSIMEAEALLPIDARGGQRLEDLVAAGCVAEAAGVLKRALNTSIEYLKLRKQFGQPLSSLQVVQHAMAEVYVVSEQMRSLVKAVSEGLEGPDSTYLVSAAKAYLGIAGYRAVEKCIQFHGGMGITEEYPIGHYYKRLLVLGAACGSASGHLQRMAFRIRSETR